LLNPRENPFVALPVKHIGNARLGAPRDQTLGRGDGRPSVLNKGRSDDRLVTRVERTEFILTRALSPRRRRDTLRIAARSRSMHA